MDSDDNTGMRFQLSGILFFHLAQILVAPQIPDISCNSAFDTQILEEIYLQSGGILLSVEKTDNIISIR